ncbi:MAG: hypothetical protein EHM33_14480 [Chloroflexi bacterium]|nr:MAG: hypothetical protein EHM33_14480 [Chloroflexota bacterium]
MHSISITLSENKFWIFLATLSVIALILAGVATSKYGAGVSSDSTKYLSVAQNLLVGNGLYDHKGGPLLSWPPLYSMILAGLSLLSGLDVFVAGWYFNVFLLGLNVFLSGVILYRVFSEKPLYAYLASLFVFLSISSLRIHANISSDPFYLTLTLGFLIAVDGYIKRRSYHAFAWMALFSILAPLQRYVGLAITVTAEIVILIENRKSMRTWLRDGFILGFASILPLAWWLIVHNIMTYGSLWGVGPQTVEVWTNTSLALTKMLHWFVPYLTFLMPVLTRPLIPLGALALILLLINRQSMENGRAWFRAFAASSVYPTLIHAIVYFVALSLTVVTVDHRSLFSDRYYVILLVPTAIFILLTFDKLVLPHLKVSFRQVQIGLILIFALWAVYPFYSFREYLLNAREQGEPSGANMFNNQTYHEMAVITELQRLREEQPDKTFYSNYSDAVWFHTRKPVVPSPVIVEDPLATYAGWPQDKPGYIVWFEPNEYKHYMPPETLAEFAEVQLIFDGTGGKIYYVQAR